jgi:glycosyltransferase involved in cell wall biosynthesis
MKTFAAACAKVSWDERTPRILSVFPDCPYPATTGLQLRMVSNIHLLRRLGCYSAVIYFSTEEHRASESDLKQLSEACDEVVYGGERNPHYRRSKISLAWDKTNYLVRGVMGWSSDRYPFSVSYDRIHAASVILEVGRSVRAQFVVLPLIFMHYARQLRTHGLGVILDASDVLSDLSRSFLKHFSGSGGKIGLLANHLACRTQELLSLKHCSEVWVTSDAEAKRFEQIAPEVPTVIVPNCLDETTVRPELSTLDPAVGFIGTYSYQPNLQAAEFLADKVFPRVVREFPAARLLLAGAGMPGSTKKRLERMSNVRVLGQVSNSARFMAACQVLALPVRVRGGVPLKLVEGLACGKAIVATPETIRGVSVVNGRDLIACDTAQDFASAVVALLRYSSFRERLANAARTAFEQHFSLSNAERSIRNNSILLQCSEIGTGPCEIGAERKRL